MYIQNIIHIRIYCTHYKTGLSLFNIFLGSIYVLYQKLIGLGVSSPGNSYQQKRNKILQMITLSTLQFQYGSECYEYCMFPELCFFLGHSFSSKSLFALSLHLKTYCGNSFFSKTKQLQLNQIIFNNFLCLKKSEKIHYTGNTLLKRIKLILCTYMSGT